MMMSFEPTKRLRSSLTGETYERAAATSVNRFAADVWFDIDDGGRLAQAPWRALCPGRVLELREPTLCTLTGLPAGTDVALLSDSHLETARLRRRAVKAGIRIDRELIVVPSITSPLVVLDDVESAVRHFWSAVAAVPPGLTWASAPASAALVVARLLPWRFTGILSPGRVLVGSRL
jgi:hypothetical protein